MSAALIHEAAAYYIDPSTVQLRRVLPGKGLIGVSSNDGHHLGGIFSH